MGLNLRILWNIWGIAYLIFMFEESGVRCFPVWNCYIEDKKRISIATPFCFVFNQRNKEKVILQQEKNLKIDSL